MVRSTDCDMYNVLFQAGQWTFDGFGADVPIRSFSAHGVEGAGKTEAEPLAQRLN